MTVLQRDYTLGRFIAGERAQFPLLRHVVTELRPDGTGVEFGVAEGTSLSIIAAHMPAVGFDSFLGLPEPWCGYPAGSRACAQPEVDNATIVAGLFAHTLATFDFAALGPIGLVHFDADLFSSTQTALDYVGPHLTPGCYVIFDEWHGAYPGHIEDHEQRAWREYVDDTGIDWAIVGHDTNAWAIRITHAGQRVRPRRTKERKMPKIRMRVHVTGYHLNDPAGSKIGDILEVDEGLAETYVRNGLAEYFHETPPMVVETATLPEPEMAMMPKRGPGRPPKASV